MERRQDASCGANGNTDTICSPQKGQVWRNDTWYQITWNPSYPTYAASDVLDIYLYYVKNFQNTMIKNWTDIAPSKANFPVFVDDSWFPSSTESTHDAYVYIVGGDVDPDQEMSDRYSDYPAPVPIQVVGEEVRDAHQETPAAGPIHAENRGLQPWVIAIVAVSCVAALAACIVMIWAVRHVRRRKLVFDEKAEAGNPGFTSSLPSSSMLYNEHFKNDSTFILPPTLDGSVRSTPRMMMSSCLPDSTIIRPQSTASCSNISTRSSDIPPISSADALMLADTFRQRMRRPDWQRQPQRQEHDEESKRRQLSEELLMQELAAEGTLMKKVGKRAQLLSAFAAADDDDDDSSNNNNSSSNNNNNNTSSSSR